MNGKERLLNWEWWQEREAQRAASPLSLCSSKPQVLSLPPPPYLSPSSAVEDPIPIANSAMPTHSPATQSRTPKPPHSGESNRRTPSIEPGASVGDSGDGETPGCWVGKGEGEWKRRWLLKLRPWPRWRTTPNWTLSYQLKIEERKDANWGKKNTFNNLFFLLKFASSFSFFNF